MRKRTFLAVSTSDLATRNRIFLPPCRIRSTALKAAKGRGRCRRARPGRSNPKPPEWDGAPGSHSQDARCHSRA